ncbi:MAG TPA: hypothetical protein VH934_17600, partial [Xanthobacteraceae bacterium]
MMTVHVVADRNSRSARELARMLNSRHARPCAGHPRLSSPSKSKDVDGRDKPGHDIELNKAPISYPAR